MHIKKRLLPKSFFFYYHCDGVFSLPQEDKYIHAAISVEHPLCPPIKNLTRAQVRNWSSIQKI